MARAAHFPLPRRGEVRYALARAAAVLSSLLLLAAAAPLAREPVLNAKAIAEPLARDPIFFLNAAPAPVDIKAVAHPAEHDVHIRVSASPLASASPNTFVAPSASQVPSTESGGNSGGATGAAEDHVVIDTTSTSASETPASPAQSAAGQTPAASQTAMPSSVPASAPTENLNKTSSTATANVPTTSNSSAQTSAAPAKTPTSSTASLTPLESFVPTKTPASSVATATGANTTAMASTAPSANTSANTSQDNSTSAPPTGDSAAIPEPSSPLVPLEPIASFVPTGPDAPIIAELPSPDPIAPSASPSLSTVVQTAPSTSSSPPAPSAPVSSSPIPPPVSPAASASPSVSAVQPATPPTASGIKGMPSPKAGQNIVVFPILLRTQGSRTVSKELDSCIRRLAAKRTETTPGEWALVGVRDGTSSDEIEARYAMSFSRDNTAGVKEFETYVEQAMSKDIANNCNINDVSIVGAGSIIAAVGVAPDVSADGSATKIALAASVGGIILLAIVGGVFALVYTRRRNDVTGGEYSRDGSYTSSHDPSVPSMRPGLRFSSSRDAGPGPHTLVEAMGEEMGGLPIREIPVSEEGETMTSNTYTGNDDGSTSIYEDDANSRELDFAHEGPSEHSLQAFTGAWGALADADKAVSEPGDEVDDDGNDADYEESAADGEESGSSSGFGDGGHPEPPSSNSVNLHPGVDAFGGVVGASESFGHPHDYLIGIGPTSGSTPVPGEDYIVPDLGEQD